MDRPLDNLFEKKDYGPASRVNWRFALIVLVAVILTIGNELNLFDVFHLF